MSHPPLYNPFKLFHFDSKTCFLSGKSLQAVDEQIQVFPLWLMRHFDLEDKPFKMLDESVATYKQLKLPCSVDTADQLAEMETRVEAAFKKGYFAVRDLDEVLLFQWIAKIVYGTVFNEIQAGVRQQLLSGGEMNFSQVLAHKFKNLHLMLQSLILPMQFDGARPFSIKIYPVDNLEGTFNYRDEINTLVFSLRMNDFGIVACLQDNGVNNIYHREALEGVGSEALHPIQFEEIAARYFYSAYLFNRLPEYTVLPTDDMVYVEPMSLSEMSMKPIFDHWQVKTYGQVLENFWKPWGFTLFEIIKDPEAPMSFLKNGADGGCHPGEIDLPKA